MTELLRTEDNADGTETNYYALRFNVRPVWRVDCEHPLTGETVTEYADDYLQAVRAVRLQIAADALKAGHEIAAWRPGTLCPGCSDGESSIALALHTYEIRPEDDSSAQQWHCRICGRQW